MKQEHPRDSRRCFEKVNPSHGGIVGMLNHRQALEKYLAKGAAIEAQRFFSFPHAAMLADTKTGADLTSPRALRHTFRFRSFGFVALDKTKNGAAR